MCLALGALIHIPGLISSPSFSCGEAQSDRFQSDSFPSPCTHTQSPPEDLLLMYEYRCLFMEDLLMPVSTVHGVIQVLILSAFLQKQTIFHVNVAVQ